MAITREEAIALAEQRMHPLIVKFDQQLQEKVTVLRGAIADDNIGAALVACHSLAGEAATFGWTYVGQHAANLRSVLGNQSSVKREELLDVGLQALDMLSQIPMKDQAEAGKAIVDEYATVISVLEQRAGEGDSVGEAS